MIDPANPGSDLCVLVGAAPAPLVWDRHHRHRKTIVFHYPGASRAEYPIGVLVVYDTATLERALVDIQPQTIAGEGVPDGITTRETNERVARICENFLATKHTIETYAGTWLRNGLANLPELIKHPSVHDFPEHRNMPCIIIGAGPSLNKNVDQLKDWESKAYLFACQHALGTLAAHGIKINGAACADHQPLCLSHFEKYDTSGLDLMLAASVHPPIWRLPARQKYGFTFGGCEWLCAAMGEEMRIETCDTVTVPMVALAIRKGFDPIIMVGQDLANRDTYAEGSGEMLPDKAPGDFEVTAWDGQGKVMSTSYFKMAIDWFARVKACEPGSKRTLWNCTEGGAQILGWIHAPLATLTHPNGAREGWPLRGIAGGAWPPMELPDRMEQRHRSVNAHLAGMLERAETDEQRAMVQAAIEGVMR